MMTDAEIIAFQAKERAFLETPVGKAFHKFKLAYFRMAADENRESVTTTTLRKHADASHAAEKEFRTELAKLMPPEDDAACAEALAVMNSTSTITEWKGEPP